MSAPTTEEMRRMLAEYTADTMKELRHLRSINEDLLEALNQATDDRTALLAELARHHKAVEHALAELDDRTDITEDSTGERQVPNFEGSLASDIRRMLGMHPWGPK